MFTFFHKKLTQLNNLYLKAKVKILGQGLLLGRKLLRPERILFNRAKQTGPRKKRPFKNSSFCFGLVSFILFGLLIFSSGSLAKLSYPKNSDAVFFNSFFKNADNLDNNNLFFSQNEFIALETPDLKIIQDNFIYGISPPRVLTTQTLGVIFGEMSQDKKDIIEYSVQPGDTFESITQSFNISLNTLLWANNLSKNSTLKIGQNLIVLPVSGVVHIVKLGDTISEIGKTYKSKVDDIVAFNNLTSEGDIFIGDILIVPGGVMPSNPLSSVQAPLADNFFIYPAEGRITQGLHWYNAVDLANKCGTSIYAAASGTVQRARYGWNYGGGNQITILHSNGAVTYYGHLMTVFVKPGDKIDVGERVALMGGGAGMEGAGISTGCHLHFGVIGAKNPLVKYPVGTIVKYK